MSAAQFLATRQADYPEIVFRVELRPFHFNAEADMAVDAIFG